MALDILNQDTIKKCAITISLLFLFAINLSMADGDFYLVKKNDTLYRIAKKSGKTVDELVRLNKISPPYNLEVGQKIRLSPMVDPPSDAVEKKIDDAMARLFRDAQSGESDAQLKLGWLYFMGDNLHQDYEKGIIWLQKSADQGNPDAQNRLGTAYSKGAGVKQDFRKAVAWFLKSARQGFYPGQMNLGVIYDFGLGIPENNEEAAIWYRLAASGGHAAAQHNLGIFYENGEGVAKNLEDAFKWFSMAAEQGFTKSKERLLFLNEKFKNNSITDKGMRNISQ